MPNIFLSEIMPKLYLNYCQSEEFASEFLRKKEVLLNRCCMHSDIVKYIILRNRDSEYISESKCIVFA